MNRAGVRVNQTAADVNRAVGKVNAADRKANRTGRIVFSADDIVNRTGRNVIRSVRIVFNNRASEFLKLQTAKPDLLINLPPREIIIQNIAPFDL